MSPNPEPVVADASVLMNLVATGAISEILRALGLVFHVPPAVAGEMLYLESMEPGGPREQIDLAPLEQSGVLTRIMLQDHELNILVELARIVDDGEAEAIAAGLSRQLKAATDDRKARRVAAERGVSLLSTAELLHSWQQLVNVPSTHMAEILGLIGRRSRYRPPTADPLLHWWLSTLASL